MDQSHAITCVWVIKRKQNFDVIMDDTFIHSTKEEHMDNLMDLFKVVGKYGLKISPYKCQGHGPPTWALFGENVCKNERIGSHRGACAGHAPLDLPMDMNILQVVYWQLLIEVNCVSLLLYTFIYLYMNFMPFYINDSGAPVTHFSSTLIISLDQLTK